MKVYSEKEATRNPVAHLDDLSENNFTLISDCFNVSRLVYSEQFNGYSSLPYVIVWMGNRPGRRERGVGMVWAAGRKNAGSCRQWGDWGKEKGVCLCCGGWCGVCG